MQRHDGDNKRDPTAMDSDPDAWRDSFHAERFPDQTADEVTVDTLANRSVLPQASLEGDTDADGELSEPARRPGYLGESARIGRYAVLRQLGEGGMGVVYSAYDEGLDRRVALKLLRPGRDNSPHNQARMQREARAMARLSHPNVVQVYEVGRWEEQVYLAMEFVQGRTLGAWLKTQPRTWQQTLDVLVQAGRGLHAAHQANVVHGDFKPESGSTSQVPENIRISRLRCGCVPILYQAQGPVKMSSHEYAGVHRSRCPAHGLEPELWRLLAVLGLAVGGRPGDGLLRLLQRFEDPAVRDPAAAEARIGESLQRAAELLKTGDLVVEVVDVFVDEPVDAGARPQPVACCTGACTLACEKAACGDGCSASSSSCCRRRRPPHHGAA